MTRLLQFSDLHFGAEIPAAVDALVRTSAALAPDGILIGGDFTMRARRREWRAARAFLDRLSAPTLSIPGNHDIPAFNHLWHRLFHPFERYRAAIDEELEPSAVFGNVEVVGLNTARRFGGTSLNWSHGAVSAAQCLSLPLRFKTDAPLRAVMVHHPLHAPDRNDRRLLKRDGLLLAALEKANVDLLLAGHFHQSYAAPLPLPLGQSDIVLSHVSTACSWRVKGEAPGFHALDLSPARIDVTAYRFDEASAAFNRHRQLSFEKSGDRWTTLGPREKIGTLVG